MRVMIDTNVLISAIYSPNSLPAQTVQSVGNEHTLVLSEYILEECRAVFDRKFPHHLSAFEAMLVGFKLEIVPSAGASSVTLTDTKDQPILNSAIASKVDILVTGDKGFFGLDIKHPKVVTPAEFLKQMA